MGCASDRAGLCFSESSALGARVTYRQRDPEATVLFRAVQDHLEDFLEEARRRSPEGSGVPRFVEDELRRFLECGSLANGFARLKCEDCGGERFVPFSCKRRGVCPSCAGRRMSERAAHLVDTVMPYAPVRQWVLSLPFALRYRMAWDHRLSRRVLRCFIRELDKFYRKQARKLGIRRAKTGAVTVIQRSGGALNLNVHFHTAALDGVFTMSADGKLAFDGTRPPSGDEIKELVKRIRKRVLKMLKRARISLVAEDVWDDPLVDEYPALAAACSASIQQLIALGPRAGRQVMRLGQEPNPDEVEHAKRRKNTRHARFQGFDLYASPPVGAKDRSRLERMLRYLLRPPVAQGRLHDFADGRVALELKEPWNDGTSHILFEPLELLEKLAAIIPRPQSNQIIYHGVLGARAKWRKQVVKYGRPEMPVDDDADAAEPEKQSNYISWSDLMRRTFNIDVMMCTDCGGRMKFIALIEDPDVIKKILEHEGLPTETPKPRPARPPPEQQEIDFDGFSDADVYAE
jgi:hypothetical protein